MYPPSDFESAGGCLPTEDRDDNRCELFLDIDEKYYYLLLMLELEEIRAGYSIRDIPFFSLASWV